MKRFSLLVIGIVGAMGLAGSAQAQQSAHDCENVPMRIDVGGQPMATAIPTLSEQTHCPISIDADVKELDGNMVQGRMTPAQALATLVRGTGLEIRTIKGGFSVGHYKRRQLRRRY